jgi:hypothetical protein
MCGPKRDEAAGGWRKLHNEDQIVNGEMGKAYRMWEG